MPLTRKHFDLGIDSAIEEWMKRIHAFVGSHKDEAFTRTELEDELLPEPRSMTQMYDFRTALDKLVDLGAIERREVKGLIYHSSGPEPLDRVLG